LTGIPIAFKEEYMFIVREKRGREIKIALIVTLARIVTITEDNVRGRVR
jgi:hypothetical protein